MVKRRAAKKSAKTKTYSDTCKVCGGNCHEKHAHLPGYLLIAFGLLLFPINFDLIPGVEWAKAWPLVLVLFGFVYISKVTICRIMANKK
jgi:hypothetical protein